LKNKYGNKPLAKSGMQGAKGYRLIANDRQQKTWREQAGTNKKETRNKYNLK
jgi:hypothetical protein